MIQKIKKNFCSVVRIVEKCPKSKFLKNEKNKKISFFFNFFSKFYFWKIYSKTYWAEFFWFDLAINPFSSILFGFEMSSGLFKTYLFGIFSPFCLFSLACQEVRTTFSKSALNGIFTGLLSDDSKNLCWPKTQLEIASNLC